MKVKLFLLYSYGDETDVEGGGGWGGAGRWLTVAWGPASAVATCTLLSNVSYLSNVTSLVTSNLLMTSSTLFFFCPMTLPCGDVEPVNGDIECCGSMTSSGSDP